jgi:hypothetical protein
LQRAGQYWPLAKGGDGVGIQQERNERPATVNTDDTVDLPSTGDGLENWMHLISELPTAAE